MAVVVNEPLNCEAWTLEQQQAVFSELSKILDITPGCDYSSMTDAELSEALNEVSVEMVTRPEAVSTAITQVNFLDDVIYLEKQRG